PQPTTAAPTKPSPPTTSVVPPPITDSGSSAPAPIASAAALPSDAGLPTTTSELLAELAKRAESVATILQKGDLSGVWYPAIGTKDVALALEQNHINELPEAERPKLASAVRRLTLAAWRIDSAGDLGNRELLLPLHRDFAAAVADIQAIYGTR